MKLRSRWSALQIEIIQALAISVLPNLAGLALSFALGPLIVPKACIRGRACIAQYPQRAAFTLGFVTSAILAHSLHIGPLALPPTRGEHGMLIMLCFGSCAAMIATFSAGLSRSKYFCGVLLVFMSLAQLWLTAGTILAREVVTMRAGELVAWLAVASSPLVLIPRLLQHTSVHIGSIHPRVALIRIASLSLAISPVLATRGSSLGFGLVALVIGANALILLCGPRQVLRSGTLWGVGLVTGVALSGLMIGGFALGALPAWYPPCVAASPLIVHVYRRVIRNRQPCSGGDWLGEVFVMLYLLLLALVAMRNVSISGLAEL